MSDGAAARSGQIALGGLLCGERIKEMGQNSDFSVFTYTDMNALATPLQLEHPPFDGRRTRDRDLVQFVGRHGAVAIEHVMAAMGTGRTMAYRRVAACVDRGLLERLDLVRAEPTLLRATRQGLRFAGLGLDVARVSPGSVNHWLTCASTALMLAAEFGPEAIVTARELRLNEQIEGRPIASAKTGDLPTGEPRLHRPDLAILTDAKPIAIEVELTPKAPRRLERLMRAWRRARWVAEVRYCCAPGATRRAVERAVRKARAEERVRILEALR